MERRRGRVSGSRKGAGRPQPGAVRNQPGEVRKGRAGGWGLGLTLSPRGLAGHQALGTACTDVYRGFSDCVLKLGENMATYEEEESIEPQGLHRVCGYWDEFHICALTVLWECQKEAAAVWEMLRRESQKVKFRGSLFDLCSPSTAQSSAWTQVPKLSVLGIPLIVTWLNSGPAAL
uniref:Neuritin-like protein n=1 Tax=Cairina moschata TaxID=8855 RepID=A0A8C3D0E7_CAIMO